MNAYIANTDYNWYKYLSTKKDLDEANFWRPTGNAPLATLSQGEPLNRMYLAYISYIFS